MSVFALDLPLLAQRDDADSYHALLSSLSGQVTIPENIRTQWEQEAQAPDLPLVDCLHLGYMRLLGPQGLLYSPLQEGRYLEPHSPAVERHVLNCLQKMYETPSRLHDALPGPSFFSEQSPGVLPWALYAHIFSSATQEQYSQWFSERQQLFLKNQVDIEVLPARPPFKI